MSMWDGLGRNPEAGTVSDYLIRIWQGYVTFSLSYSFSYVIVARESRRRLVGGVINASRARTLLLLEVTKRFF